VRIVVGHANPDFDAYASTVAVTKLFEGAKGVFLGSQNTNVRRFHNLHEEFFDFVDLRGLDLAGVDSVVMVDTRDPDRVGEFRDVVTRPGVEVIVYDHHPPQEGDLVGADDRGVQVGATTSILVHEIRQREIELSVLEASLMLLGIHEDTGSLTYPGSTAFDAEAATWLMSIGADMEVLNQFLARTLDPAQQKLLAQLQHSLVLWDINGQQVAVGTAEADEYVDSASVLTHYVVEDMGFRVAVGIVRMPERLQVVARSRLSEVDVGAVMKRIGGGGHAQAASAGFRDLSVAEALVLVREALEAVVRPPLRACDVMSTPVRTIGSDTSMADAGELMAKWGHGGVPVVDEGRLSGIVTRKDVDKALRHGLEHAPVRGFIGKDVVTVGPDVDLSELEQLLASRGIGRVPVIAGGSLVGIVTRKDVLRAEHGDAYLDRGLSKGHPQARDAFMRGVDRLLPPQIRQTLRRLGEIAESGDFTAYVVGGFVRDMILGRPNLDVDIVVEGDGVAFAETVASQLSARIKVHRRFGTAVIVFSRDFHVDVASSRAEYYTRPGALPTVERSSLRQDLLRRDFTINAMSACLDPECFGAIADPFGGLADLKAGVVRVMHALSFVDDPTRVLRAARFEQRYGFAMDGHSEQLARRAVAMGLVEEVSGARIREELYDILDETDPVAVLARLDELGALPALLPAGADRAHVIAFLGAVAHALESPAEVAPGRVSQRTAFLSAIGASGTRGSAVRWLRHLRVGHEHSDAVLAFAERGPTVARALQDRRRMKDSRLFRLLDPLPAETVVCLWAAGDANARERIERFTSELSRVKPAVSGRDLIAMGATPGEAFSAILARARDDRLDGRAVGRQSELANLRRLAQRAGILIPGKDI